MLLQGGAEKELRSAFRGEVPNGKQEPADSKRLVLTLAGAVYAARQTARSSARRRLAAELLDLGIPVTGYQWVVENRRLADERAAEAVSRSLGRQWSTVAERAVAEDETPRARLMRARLARVARTEVAVAYSEEHREALRDVVAYDRRFRDGALAEEIASSIRRRWSAMADACERCWPLDGEEVGIDESFSAGEPGGMHPHCACVEYLVRAR